MSYDPEAACAKLTAFVEMLTETALRQTALDKMTGDEQAVLRKTVDRLGWAIEELTKVIGEHPQSSVQDHALNELLGALSASFVIGNRATMNPVAERIEREAEAASAAHANLSNIKNSMLFDNAIVWHVKPIWEKHPTLRYRAEATAKAIIESCVLSDQTIGPDAVRKRISKLMESGRLASRPPISRTTDQPSG